MTYEQRNLVRAERDRAVRATVNYAKEERVLRNAWADLAAIVASWGPSGPPEPAPSAAGNA